MKCNDWEWPRSMSFMLRSRTVSSGSPLSPSRRREGESGGCKGGGGEVEEEEEGEDGVEKERLCPLLRV